MLQAYVDNKAISPPPATCRTLTDLISLVTREYLPADRIVQQLVVNGQNYFTLQPEYLDFVLQDPEHFRQIQRVEIASVPVAQLTLDSITEAIDYSAGLLLGLQNIAQKLRAGQIQEGMHFYVAALDGIGSLMDLLTTLESVLHLDYSQRVVNGVSVRESLAKIAPQIQALVAAQEQNDLVMMADILEYDVHDTLGQWKLVLHDLAQPPSGVPTKG